MIEYDWKTLSDNQFEDLCKDILIESGLEAVNRVSGPGSGDMGRDVAAKETVALKIGAIETYKILVQCKNYGKSRTTISPDDVDKYSMRAKSLNYDRLLIITSHDLSAQAKIICEDISKNPNYNVKVTYWTELDLVSRLIRFPKLSERYFGSFPHSKKIKCDVEGPFMWVPVQVSYNNKIAQTRLLVGMEMSNTTIPSNTAKQLGIEFDPPEPVSLSPTLFSSTNPFTINTRIQKDMKILEDAELAFYLSDDQTQFYRIKVQELHVYKDDFPTFFGDFGFLGLDVLRNFGISIKDGMLYPQ